MEMQLTNRICKRTAVFVDKIIDLSEVLPAIVMSLGRTQKSILTEIKNEMPLPEQRYHISSGLMRKLKLNKRFRTASDIVPQTFIVSLVSEYDAFLSDIYLELFRNHPGSFSIKDRKLAFEEVEAAGSIDNLKETLIRDEVSQIIRQSHTEHIELLEKKVGIKIIPSIPMWSDFIEVCLRRNLYAHTSGVVSQEYIDGCNRERITIQDGVEVGKKLAIDGKYFRRATNSILEIAILVSYFVGCTFASKHSEQIAMLDECYNQMCYSLIDGENYELALSLLNIALSNKVLREKAHSNSDMLIFTVNAAQCYKWLGRSGEMREVVNRADWKGLDKKFLLARAVLLDDYVLAGSLMKEIGNCEDGIEMSYCCWPLYKSFRESKEFQEVYKEIFGHDYRVKIENADLVSEGNEEAHTTTSE